MFLGPLYVLIRHYVLLWDYKMFLSAYRKLVNSLFGLIHTLLFIYQQITKPLYMSASTINELNQLYDYFIWMVKVSFTSGDSSMVICVHGVVQIRATGDVKTRMSGRGTLCSYRGLWHVWLGEWWKVVQDIGWSSGTFLLGSGAEEYAACSYKGATVTVT